MDSDDDDFLYGDSAPLPTVVRQVQQPKSVTPIETETPVPEPIPFPKREPSNDLYTPVEEKNVVNVVNGNGALAEEPVRHEEMDTVDEVNGDEEGEAEGEDADGNEEDESEDDVEFIMEPPARSLDLRPNRPSVPARTSNNYTPNKAPHPPGPSLTTEYTPRERGAPVTKPTPTPQASATTLQQNAAVKTPSTSTSPQPENQQAVTKMEEGPDPSTLPPVTAPPSHTPIDPSIPGTLDGRPVFEVDMANMVDKAWRRPGSDISDWFNYGFDEISWEAYCYRRREIGEAANVLKANVVNFAGMPEEQLTQLPPEIRTMVMAGADAMLSSGGAGQMMPPGMNMNAMMGADIGNMNMPQMMNPMMVGMGGEMGMDGAPPQQPPPDQMQGMGDAYQQGYPQGGPQGPMGMPPEYMQDPGMQQQMYPQMEVPVAPSPVQVGGGRGMPPFRGNRGMMRGGRGSYAPRGRVAPVAPVRPASPLPPNVPTGPRNQNKYKDRDNNAQAVDGLDYGGGGGGVGGVPGQDRGSGTPSGEFDERGTRKRRDRSPSDDRRDVKRR